jgi:hypothetical protein
MYILYFLKRIISLIVSKIVEFCQKTQGILKINLATKIPLMFEIDVIII